MYSYYVCHSNELPVLLEMLLTKRVTKLLTITHLLWMAWSGVEIVVAR